MWLIASRKNSEVNAAGVGCIEVITVQPGELRNDDHDEFDWVEETALPCHAVAREMRPVRLG